MLSKRFISKVSFCLEGSILEHFRIFMFKKAFKSNISEPSRRLVLSFYYMHYIALPVRFCRRSLMCGLLRELLPNA
jgi:hypothetical protein